MCVVSMVFDHYDKVIPYVYTTTTPNLTLQKLMEAEQSSRNLKNESPMSVEKELLDIKQLISDFRDAVKAAKTVDTLTQQQDCVDPEKEKLILRIEKLELLLSEQPEFVIVTGGQIEPGKYRVINKKLYKLVE